MSGTSSVQVRKGKNGPVVLEERRVRPMSKKDEQSYEDIVGDGKAEVTRGFTFGVSEEISNGLWMKADVFASCKLTCDQSAVGVEDANELARDLAKEWALEELEKAHEFLREFKD